LTGKFAKDRRNRLVLSTKYSLAVKPRDPNAAGNGRKSMLRSVEDSLRRLCTDHIDLLFLHVWDNTTLADEILRGFDALVRQGKLLYIGLSDTPAWHIARLQAMAELRDWTQFAALQIEYSLLQHTPERELIPAARALGFGVMPWGLLRALSPDQQVRLDEVSRIDLGFAHELTSYDFIRAAPTGGTLIHGR
jgi:aryl-alcohol dehydrogenase-like predicted oxidoreductase